MGVKEASRQMEFTNPRMHAGWQGGHPVFVVFSLESAKSVFDEFDPGVIVLCIAVPYAARAETYEQAIHFYRDDKVAAIVDRHIFAI